MKHKELDYSVKKAVGLMAIEQLEKQIKEIKISLEGLKKFIKENENGRD